MTKRNIGNEIITGLEEIKAHFMGVSVATLRNWEQERRESHGLARSLLLVAARQPDAVRDAFRSGSPRPMKRGFAAAGPALKNLWISRAA